VLDKAVYSASESTLNSSIVSYRMACPAVADKPCICFLLFYVSCFCAGLMHINKSAENGYEYANDLLRSSYSFEKFGEKHAKRQSS